MENIKTIGNKTIYEINDICWIRYGSSSTIKNQYFYEVDIINTNSVLRHEYIKSISIDQFLDNSVYDTYPLYGELKKELGESKDWHGVIYFVEKVEIYAEETEKDHIIHLNIYTKRQKTKIFKISYVFHKIYGTYRKLNYEVNTVKEDLKSVKI